MVRVAAVLAAILLTAVLAGCVGTEPAETTTSETQAPEPPFVPARPGFDFSTVVDPDHASHQVPELHDAGHGLAVTGHAAVQEILPTGVRGSIGQVDVWGDYAVVSGVQGGLGFVIVDIRDAAAPKAVGWFPSAADGWTARFSDDGAYVFYGCQMFGAPYEPQTEVRGTCEDPEALHTPLDDNPAGVTVVDVRDKTDPKFVDFLPTAGSHNLVVASIGGHDYVFTNGVDVVRFDREAGKLESVGSVPGRHDASVARHPVTKDWLLFTGAGELAIWNVNDPANPTPIFEGSGDEGWTGWHEQTLVPGLVDGRVLLILAGETFVDVPGPDGGLPDVVSIVDVTDPAAPQLLGTWQPPFRPKAPWMSYLFSVHEIAATPEGQVAVAWYHGGAWVFDVSTRERQSSPVTLAAYQPSRLPNVVPATFLQTPQPVVPMVWGLGWSARGHLVVPDMHTGLYLLEPEWGLRPAIDGGQ